MDFKTEKNKNNLVVVAGIILILAVLLFTLFRNGINSGSKPAPDANQPAVNNSNLISPSDLEKKIQNNENISIIDIRDANDFLYEHIQGSTNIPFAQLAGSDLQDSGKTFVIVDYADSAQSSQALQILKSKNINSVLVLSGGITNWKQNQGDIISYGDPNSFTDQAKVTYITSADLKNLIGGSYSPFIIDVRNSQSFLEGRIPKANNIFLDSLEKMKSKIPIGSPVVVYGESDLDSFQAGVRLYDLNFYSVKVLEGGFSDWQQKGFQIEK